MALARVLRVGDRQLVRLVVREHAVVRERERAPVPRVRRAAAERVPRGAVLGLVDDQAVRRAIGIADGHRCGCLSTSILAWEALRRLEADMLLQIIVVPTHCWERVATDLSSPEALRRITIFKRFCSAISIRPKDVTKFSDVYREVVLDKGQLLSDGPPPPDFYVFEVPPDNETVAGVKGCCKDAYDVMHQVCGRFLEAENHARNALVHLATPSFRSWLSSKRPPHAPMPERSPPPL